MTSEPKAPGASAIYRSRQVDRKEAGRTTHTEFNYVRVKILTEEGRKYANVEIPYSKAVSGISGIRAEGLGVRRGATSVLRWIWKGGGQ